MAGFEVFTAINVQVEAFWNVTTCSDVVGYQRFGGPGTIHLQGRAPWLVACNKYEIQDCNWK